MFKIAKRALGAVEPFEYLPSDAQPALRVLPTTVFETQSSATVAATLVGSKVTLGADAASVTATTDSGVFTIDWTDGAATNSRVRGHFE